MTYNSSAHIRNVYLTAVHHSRHFTEKVLVIETDLSLPRSRFETRDPRIEDLLLELSNMKLRNPELFRSVDTVEIRDARTHMNDETNSRPEESDDVRAGLSFVTGNRVLPARAAHM